MRKTFGVSLLVLLLSVTTAAGVMPNGSPAPEPTPTPQTVTQQADGGQDPTVAGVMPNGVMPNGLTVTLTQTALNLFTVLSSLL